MHRTHAAAVKLLTNALVRPASGAVPQAERSNRNQRSNCNQRGVQRVPRQPDLRKVDRLLGLQYASLEETPPKEQVLAAAVSDPPLATPVHAVRLVRACDTAMAPSSVMNSRRFIQSPRRRGRPAWERVQGRAPWRF
jgi:hypothetical protein